MAHGYLSAQDLRNEDPSNFIGGMSDLLKKLLKAAKKNGRPDDKGGVIVLQKKGDTAEPRIEKVKVSEVEKKGGGLAKRGTDAIVKRGLGALTNLVNNRGGAVTSPGQKALPPGSVPRLPGSADAPSGGGPTPKKKFDIVDGGPKGLNIQSYLNKDTGDVDIEGLRASGASPGDMKMLVKEGRQIKRDQGIAPTGESLGAPPIPSAPVGDSGAQIVAALSQNTAAIVRMESAVKDQTANDTNLANQEIQASEQMFAQQRATLKETAMEKGGPSAGALAAAGSGAPAGGGGGGGLGGLLGMGASLLGGMGGLGKGMKGLGKGLKGIGGKLLGKGAGKGLLKGAGKGLLKGGLKMGIKKIPIAGLLAGGVFAAQRAMAGDLAGAGLELASGAASTVPGVGTAASLGIDAALMARDASMPQASGGAILSGPKSGYPAMMHGTEMVLSGNKSKATLKIGEALAEGQLRFQKLRKNDFARLAGEGLKFYFEKMSGFGTLLKGIGALISLIPGVKGVGNMLKNMFGAAGKFLFGDGKDNPTGAARVNLDDVDVTATEKSGAIGRVLPTAKGQAPPTATAHAQDASKPSNFGEIRDGGRMHMGADIGMDANSPVTAIQDGKVVDAYNSGFGLHGGAVVVKHDDGSAYVYGHVEPNVKTGDVVKAGEKIAKLVYYPSPDGTQDYTHLHLERYQTHGDRSTAVDPIAHMAKENINPVRVQTALEEEEKAVNKTLEQAGTAGAQGLTKNYGLKDNQKFFFMHNGGRYEAYKTKKGFDIYKHAGNIIPQKLDTSDGQNADVVRSLIEAGEQRLQPRGNASTLNQDSTTVQSNDRAAAGAAPVVVPVTDEKGKTGSTPVPAAPQAAAGTDGQGLQALAAASSMSKV